MDRGTNHTRTNVEVARRLPSFTSGVVFSIDDRRARDMVRRRPFAGALRRLVVGLGPRSPGQMRQRREARRLACRLERAEEPGCGALQVLDDEQAFACWLHFCMKASATPRSRLLLESFVAWIPVAVRAGGSDCLEGIASAVVDVADWFP